MKLPTTFPAFEIGYQKQETEKPINDSLKGLKPVTDLREDLNFLKMNNIFSKDSYYADCRTEVKTKDLVRQLTNTCGGG